MLSPHVSAPLAVVALCGSVVAGAATTVTAPAEKRTFNLPRGDAAVTLKQFATAAGTPIVYLVDRVRGATTNAVTGEFTPREALDRMLAGSGLEAAQDAATGALVVSRKRTTQAQKESEDSERSRGPPTGDPNLPPITLTNAQSHPKESPAMKKLTLFTLLAGWFLTTGAADAQTAENGGTISGIVSNAATHNMLEGARITVPQLNRTTVTDNTGRFLLSGVPSGTVSVVVDYIGMGRQTVVVDVPAGGLVQREIELQREGAGATPGQGAVIRMEKFSVVEDSQMSAQAISVNEQRNSANIKNVVALGEFGDRGSENIGEFLLFIPGVSIINTGNEPDTISMRGIPANNTGLLLDGAQIATGEYNTRNVSLRAVPMANISRVEVTKVPTPDTPASGLGGTVNLISSSGFDKKEAEFSYNVYWQFHNTTGFTFDGGRRWQLPETTAKFNEPNVDVGYTLPVNSKFAITLSAARTWRINPNQGDESATWDLVRNVQTSSNWGRITQQFKTTSGQIGADWRLSARDTLSASLSHRKYQRPTTRSNFAVAFGAGATGDQSFSQGTATAVGSTSQGSNWRVDDLETTQGSLKYRHQGVVWKIDASAGWSESKATQADVSRGFFNNANASISNLVIRGEDIPAADGLIPRRFSATDRLGAPVDLYRGENYSLTSGTSGEYARRGVITQARADASRAFDSAVPLTVKVGAAMNQEKRNARSFLKTWNFRPNGATDVAARLAGKFPVFDEEFLKNPPQIAGVPYRTVSHKKLYELFQSNPTWFVLDEPLAHQNLVNNSREYTETVSAAYVRTDLRLLNKRLWIATGVRYEKTSGKGSGPLDDINAQYQRDARGNFVRNAAGQRVLVTSDALALARLRYQERGARAGTEYGDYYPSLNATYDLNDRLVVRAAYARTLGRPNTNFITPGLTITDPDVANPRITVNNPDLKPWTADNFDLSLESYNFKNGFGSIGVFQKDIRNFFGSLITPASPELLALYGLENDPTYLNYSIATQVNSGDARVRGLEFGYRQSLTFLPNWARGIQVFFNATRIKLEGSKTTDFSGFTPATYSAGINYIRPRFYIKATYSYLGERNTSSVLAQSATIPANTYDYQGKITRIGLSAQYNFSRQIGVYVASSDVGALSPWAKRFSPQTPEYAKGTRYQTLGYYTTIGVKGSF